MAEAVGSAFPPANRSPKKNAAAEPRRFHLEERVDYFDTAFLKARSIFSLVASQQAWLACAACNA
jgi:hypothetical protein